MVYKDANLAVTAFLVKHGSWDEAFGYRFDALDRSIVVSGDTSPADSIARACKGCDVLLHEMYDDSELQRFGSDDTPSREYYSAFHTNPEELAAIAAKARPKLLVQYHQTGVGRPVVDGLMLDLLRGARYKGAVVSAHDLDVY